MFGLLGGRITRWVVLLDGALVLIALMLAAMGAWRMSHDAVLPDLARHWKGATVVTLGVHLVSFYVFELYAVELDFRRGRNLLRVVLAITVASAILAGVSFLVPRWSFHRSLFALHALALGTAITVSRAGLSRVLARRIPREGALLLNVRDAPFEVGAAMDAHPERRFRLLGALAPGRDPPETWRDEVRASDVRHIIVSGLDALPPEGAAALLVLKSDGVEVHDLADVFQGLAGRIPVEMVSDLYFLRRAAFTTEQSSITLNLLRLLDVAGALLLTLLAAPLWLVATLGIAVSMPGPVLFAQERVGKGGRPFTLYKFRSMRPDAERAGPQWSAPGDNRVTPFGRFLRRTRIDELPQLWNVLRGDMSLVGPRPERPVFVARLMEQIPYYALRFQVKPGLTGWAQVSFRYGSTVDDTRIKLSYDLYYVQERSLILYVAILLRTIPTVLFKPGS